VRLSRRDIDPLHFYNSCATLAPVEAEGEEDCMPDPKLDLPQGTLDLLILKALSLGAMHGWAISQRIQQVSRDTLQIPQGSLYPALHRLERKGWIRASWGESDNNRKAKFYELTRAGQARLAAETDDWARLTAAVALVLKMN
jgi:transcriptional regulator